MKKPTKPPGKGKAKAARKRPTKTAPRPFLEPTPNAVGTVDAHGVYSPPRQASELEAFATEAGEVHAGVAHLIRRANELGVSRHGFEGTGPHETQLSRDVAAALFVAWRALQAATAFAMGIVPAGWRTEVVEAREVLRGGRPDGAPNASRSMAVDTTRQAILYATGIGFVGSTEDEGVQFIRDRFSYLFGSVFLTVPTEEVIRSHMNGTSPAAKKLARARAEWQSTGSRDAWDDKLQCLAEALAADIVWAGHLEAGGTPSEAVFRFPIVDGDTSRARLLNRLQGMRGDAKRSRR